MKYLGILAALLLTIGAAVALGSADDSPTGGRVALGDVRLVAVESCDELLEFFRTTASDTDAQLLGGFGFGMGGGDDVMAARESATVGGSTPDAAAPSPATSVATEQAADGELDAGSSFSGTNVQERDVDEPDTVKTNGDVLVSAGYDGLRIIDVGDGEPRLLSTVPLEQGGSEIILSGDRVLALTSVWREDPAAAQQAGDAARLMIAIGEQVTVLTSVDISDPANPQVIETRELPGGYRSARATGTTARIVVVSSPSIPQPGPAIYDTQDPAEMELRLQEWKTEAIASMTLEDWSPAAGDCSSVARTSQPQGLSTTTVVTLDLQGSLTELDRDSVVADTGTIYASTDRLVLATSRWTQTSSPEGDVSTEIHSFDITDPAQTAYVGSGAVNGFLLNQFALSEHEGNIRVATTEQAPWDPETNTSNSDSGITVLDASLQQIGRIDGLGVTEQIQAVRYMGDVAYVVTFRQTDPLYAIDLSDPTAPRVAGELKVPGYSAYLHPYDEGRLLGVGQDATDEGQTLGTKLSTFDVSSIDSPTEIDSLRIDGGSSAVEWDHRAFLWWGDTRTAFIPVDIYPRLECPEATPNTDCFFTEEQTRPYSGAVAFGIGDDGAIVEQGRVTHQTHLDPNVVWPAIQRSVVVGDALYTISEGGVLKSDLSSLADEGFVAFPLPQLDDQPIPVEGDGGIGSSGSSGASTPEG